MRRADAKMADGAIAREEEMAAPNSVSHQMAERVILLLLLVMAVSVVSLWSLDPVSPAGQSRFALFLSVDFVAFAMMSYLARTVSGGGFISRGLVVVGCAFLMAVMFLGLAI